MGLNFTIFKFLEQSALCLPRVDPLGDDQKREFHDVQGSEELTDNVHFLRFNLFDLAFSDTVSIKDNSLRGSAVIFDIPVKKKDSCWEKLKKKIVKK